MVNPFQFRVEVQEKIAAVQITAAGIGSSVSIGREAVVGIVASGLCLVLEQSVEVEQIRAKHKCRMPLRTVGDAVRAGKFGIEQTVEQSVLVRFLFLEADNTVERESFPRRLGGQVIRKAAAVARATAALIIEVIVQ